MKENVSIKEAAEMLNVSQQFLRVALQQNKFDFGTAIKMNDSSSKYTYYISRKKLSEFLTSSKI
jgi:hypothetical protein